MEFQLLSATIEDKYPPGFDAEVTTYDLTSPDFPEGIYRQNIVKRSVGAIAFLFGRMENGDSVCVRIEGVKPKLFFSASNVTTASLKLELEREVRRELYRPERDDGPPADKIEIRRAEYTHMNGFEPDETSASGRRLHTYFEALYPSLRAHRKAVELRKHPDSSSSPPREAHEMNVDSMTRFFRDAGIMPGKWHRLAMFESCTPVVSSCAVEVSAAIEDVRVLDRMDMSPYCTAYYDLETLGLEPTTSEIIQWSIVFEKNGVCDKHVVMIGSSDPLDGVTLHTKSNEEALLICGRDLIIQHDPDFMVAYNGVNFDNRFLAVRAARYNRVTDGDRPDPNKFFYCSRFALRPCNLRELALSSSGMGDNKYNYIPMDGRATVDFFVKFKVDEPSEKKFSLSHFVRKYIPGDDKEEMDYKEIPKLQAGDSSDRKRLASYCVHDSYLLAKLNEARNILVNVIQFAAVFGVLPEWVYFRGQQVRFISQVYAAARSFEQIPLLLQTPPGGFIGANDDSGFTGAVVNDPISGYYKTEPVGTLDWHSLYPSEMIAYNLCHSTQVLDPLHQSDPSVRAYQVRKLGLHWVVSEGELPSESEVLDDASALSTLLKRRFREELLKTKAVVDADRTEQSVSSFSLEKEAWEAVAMPLNARSVVRVSSTAWVRSVGDHTTYFTSAHRGILPRILSELLRERAYCKKQIKENLKLYDELKTTDPTKAARHRALADVFDGKQLAVKVSANSIYGACGAGKMGKMANKDVSETVTFMGRQTMDQLKKLLEDRYPNVTIVYGDTDSVMIKFGGVNTVDECAAVCEEAAKYVTDWYAEQGFGQMVLEFEKVFFPYLLIQKKRYIGLKYEPKNGGMECKGIDAKGVETQRKDTLPYLIRVMKGVHHHLMYTRDEYKAFEHLKEQLYLLVDKKVAFEDLIMSKGLRAEYKDCTTQVQWMVNEKKRLREAGSESAAGERVEYVIVNGPKGSKKTELAEDPVYARDNGLELNLLWYFEQAIKNPMGSLFSVISTVDVQTLFNTISANLMRVKAGGMSLKDFNVARIGGQDPVGGVDQAEPKEKLYVPRPPPPIIKRKKKAK